MVLLNLRQIGAGQYTAGLTLYGTTNRENGVLVYQLGVGGTISTYFRPVQGTGTKINEVTEADWISLLQSLPAGAINIQQVHSHPDPSDPTNTGYTYGQYPSPTDYAGLSKSQTGVGVLGLVNGSVYTYQGSGLISIN